MVVIKLLATFFAGVGIVLAQATAARKTSYDDPNDNRGKTPFLLQDPVDQTCLGPNGFTVCDENALWIITPRKGVKTFSMVSLTSPTSEGVCLERKSSFLGLLNSDAVGVGSCNNPGSKSWMFNFIDKKHITLSINDKCLSRGNKNFKNALSMKSCASGTQYYLVYHPTALHENGFYLKAADESCFDGEKFRPCSGKASNQLLWGVGVKFVWGEAKRYLYSFSIAERGNCLVGRGSKVSRGRCTDSGALDWVAHGSTLSTKKGKKCLARKPDDQGVIVNCREASEFVILDIPTLPNEVEMTRMLKNPNLTSEERAILAETIRKRGGMNNS